MLAIALLLSLWSLARVRAQVADGDRVERRIEQLDRRQQAVTVETERRFGALQGDIKVLQVDVVSVKEELSNIKNLGIGIISAVALLIVQSLWGLITMARHRPKDH